MVEKDNDTMRQDRYNNDGRAFPGNRKYCRSAPGFAHAPGITVIKINE